MSLTLSVLFTAYLLPALASDAGEPLDCSDWVSVESG
jgi:hypothetical protein